MKYLALFDRQRAVYVIQDDRDIREDGRYWGAGIYDAMTGEVINRLYRASEYGLEDAAADWARKQGYMVVPFEGEVPGDPAMPRR